MAHEDWMAFDVPWTHFEERIAARGARCEPRDEGKTLEHPCAFVVEFDGRTYVKDVSSFVVGASPDFFLNLSGEVDAMVATWSYDTIVGYTQLLVASKGGLVRFVHLSESTMREPFEMGVPLASERAAPLDRRQGIFAALQHLGFHTGRIPSDAASGVFAMPDGDALDPFAHETSADALQKAFETHHATHGKPTDQWMTGRKIAAEITYDDEGRREIWFQNVPETAWDRVRRWFGKKPGG